MYKQPKILPNEVLSKQALIYLYIYIYICNVRKEDMMWFVRMSEVIWGDRVVVTGLESGLDYDCNRQGARCLVVVRDTMIIWG